MSYDAIETSGAPSQTFDLYLFDTGSTVYALTNEDAPIAFGGRTYQPATITRDEIELSQEQNSGQVVVKLPKSHPIATLFIPRLPPVPVTLIIYNGHVGDSEIVPVFIGRVASARYPDLCELTCVTDRDELKRKIPTLLYQPSCPRVLGDAGCGVDLASVTYSGTVGTVSAGGMILDVPAFASIAHSLTSGYLRRGGDIRFVMAHAGPRVTLMTAIPGVAPGDTVEGTAGCAKTYGACVSFTNVEKFLGFDMIPKRNPFNGRLQ